jgi:hypothetical protein
MMVLGMVVIVLWVWMLATSLHLDDLRTGARRPSILARRPAETDGVPDLPARLRRTSRPHRAPVDGVGAPAG